MSTKSLIKTIKSIKKNGKIWNTEGRETRPEETKIQSLDCKRNKNYCTITTICSVLNWSTRLVSITFNGWNLFLWGAVVQRCWCQRCNCCFNELQQTAIASLAAPPVTRPGCLEGAYHRNVNSQGLKCYTFLCSWAASATLLSPP